MAVELAEVIAQLRAELTTAIAAGADEDLRFALGPVELEFTVGVEKTDAPGTKLRFVVFEANVDTKLSSSHTQRIKLTLDPKHRGRTAYISGDEVDGER